MMNFKGKKLTVIRSLKGSLLPTALSLNTSEFEVVSYQTY